MTAFALIVCSLCIEAVGAEVPKTLTRAEATAALNAAVKSIADRTRTERAAELKSGVLTIDGARMPIWATQFGAKSKDGTRPLWISMHGGGGAPAQVNDQQWDNQKHLYEPAEGVYVAPRAPSNEWNLWHQAPVDRLFDRLIEDLVICERVDPDRVYLMGYSAGGDGVYQLAPRMADRFAAASMMAGHPNDARPEGLRNLPFAIHVGGNDGAFDRNKVASQWGVMLDALAQSDPGAYVHQVEVHAGKGHWMDREDVSAVPWMAKYTRNARPQKVVWIQDDVTHPRFYWLAVDEPKQGQRIVVERQGQEINILEAPPALALRILLDDTMLDLDKDVRITQQGKELFVGRVPRSKAVIERTLQDRYDPKAAFTAEVKVITAAAPVLAPAPAPTAPTAPVADAPASSPH
ncbi:MAG: alpha/beta hydrolase [Planctomycetota bacterium]|nr:alpha/beta hydrolase [Planctomycetota bacterium]